MLRAGGRGGNVGDFVVIRDEALDAGNGGPVTLVANGIGNVGNGFAQPGLQLRESVGADGLGGGDAVMQTDNGLTVVSGHRGKVLLLVAIQSVPAIAGKQEQNQKNEKEHAFTAPSTAVAFFLAEGQQAGKIHSFVALHKGEQSRDVVHIVFSFSLVFSSMASLSLSTCRPRCSRSYVIMTLLCRWVKG